MIVQNDCRPIRLGCNAPGNVPGSPYFEDSEGITIAQPFMYAQGTNPYRVTIMIPKDIPLSQVQRIVIK